MPEIFPMLPTRNLREAEKNGMSLVLWALLVITARAIGHAHAELGGQT
jgi:hypothetical protein